MKRFHIKWQLSGVLVAIADSRVPSIPVAGTPVDECVPSTLLTRATAWLYEVTVAEVGVVPAGSPMVSYPASCASTEAKAASSAVTTLFAPVGAP